MCGIAGILYFDKDRKVSESSLKKMTDSIIHRGPDDEGFYVNNSIGLGFRRLSIIDLNTGHQPLCNENKSIWIVFNGEIYNFIELRANLKKQGHVFATKTDTETIVHLYEQYGTDCVKYLRGMFAFAIWDNNKQLLFCARDRFGIKPFYYYLDNEKFIFASEIKEILEVENVDNALSLKAIDSYFTNRYITNDLSIYKKIKKLSPSTCLTINSQTRTPETITYWEPFYDPDYSKTDSYWIEAIDSTLTDTIEKHMISDVPLGAFLSGGIDSSTVVALMNKITNTPIKTFSIGFPEKKYNELQYAREIAKKFKTEHHEYIVEPQSINLLPDLVASYDEPFADPSAIPTYFVSKFARENVTVALSGDGGDELFTGYGDYERFYKFYKHNTRYPVLNKCFWGLIHKVIPYHMYGKGMTYYLSKNRDHIGAYKCMWNAVERKKLFKPEIRNQLNNYASEQFKIDILNSSGIKDFLSNLQLMEIKTEMVDDILTKVDRASMQNSLEVRVPILDHVFAELSFKIPIETKFKFNQKKFILKQAMRSYLPADVINHKKQGFDLPLKIWFREDLSKYVSDRLLNDQSKIYDFLSRKTIESTIKNHQKGLRDFSKKLWTLLVFDEWINSVK